MYQRREVPSGLMRLANAQSGVLSREQVLSFDLSRHVIARLLNTDRWRLIDRGIYLTLPVEPSWLALAWAGILIGGVGARLGPNASSYLYKLVEPEPMPVDVLVPVARYAQRHGPWHFHRERAGARSASTHGSLPRLDVEATVLDLCARSTEGEIVGLISTAVQRRLTTSGRLSKALAARSRQRYRRLIALGGVVPEEGRTSARSAGRGQTAAAARPALLHRCRLRRICPVGRA